MHMQTACQMLGHCVSFHLNFIFCWFEPMFLLFFFGLFCFYCLCFIHMVNKVNKFDAKKKVIKSLNAQKINHSWNGGIFFLKHAHELDARLKSQFRDKKWSDKRVKLKKPKKKCMTTDFGDEIMAMPHQFCCFCLHHLNELIQCV